MTHDENERSGGLNRRQVLRATGATTGAGILGATAVQPASAQSLPDAVQELASDCRNDWESAPDGYPRVDLRSETPTTSDLPSAPDELLIYAIGWGAEGQSGYDQAYTLERALEQAGYEHPVVAAEWQSSSFNFWGVRDNADRDGTRLADWLRAYREDNPDTTVRLAGLSMGARVPIAALDDLDGDVSVASVSLFGGTIEHDVICSDSKRYDADAIERTADAVYNYHSTEDSTTCSLIPLLSFDDLVGCEGVDCEGWFSDGSPPENWHDVDVSDRIDGHCDYQTPDEGIVDLVVEDFR
ncbi:twin-arginine translocation signal domain-containing protein [Halorientalis pallida]|uniref:twin-arginine translocation signal domain-containing protein n=1 Tax=Halorientalis pallida TaxID=2479928 RepID=UPI003C702404